MSTTIEIKDSVYAKLLAKSLPRPIRTEAIHCPSPHLTIR